MLLLNLIAKIFIKIKEIVPFIIKKDIRITNDIFIKNGCTKKHIQSSFFTGT